MKILAIGSHPDDLEYGCGGTLLKFAQNKKNKINILVMTRGEMGSSPKIRTGEQSKSMQLLNAKLFWGDFQDTNVPLAKHTINEIEKIIKHISPDLIFVHYPEDTHQDHRNVSQATVTATRYLRNVLFYEVPTTQNFSPTVFVDIEKQLLKKIVLLKSHKSQVSQTRVRNLSILESVRACAIFRGFQTRIKYAEGFVPLRLALDFYE
jgi:LmbE family N-acetylglucosaminyl deacetylase